MNCIAAVSSILAVDPMEHVLSHPFFGGHFMWFTNQSFMVLVAGGLMLIIFPALYPRPDSSAPSGARNFFESILEYLRIEVFRPALKEHTDKFVPFLWTVFFFIGFCNILGCIPFADFFELISGGRIQHLGGTATGSINTTATLAIIAFFFIHFHGIDQVAKDLINGTYGHGHHQEHDSNGNPPHEAAHDLEHMRGEALPADVPGDMDALGHPTRHYHDGEYRDGETWGHPVEKELLLQHEAEQKKLTPAMAILVAIPLYLWNFAPHPFRPGPGESKAKWLIDVPFFLFLLVLELVGAVIKPFALCMRLFANMVAGHAVLAVLISLIVAVPWGLTQLAIGVPLGALNLAIQFLELFVAVLQAYIFTFLTTLFIASAVAPEH
jgi:F0F1-type ATP synthase membrane subunit a